MKRLAVLLLTLVVSGLVIGLPKTVFAEGQTQANTVSVSPATVSFSLTENEEQSAMITVRNDYDTAVDFAVELQGIDDQGGRIIPYGPLQESLQEVLRLSETQISVAAHDVAFVRVVAKNSPILQPGGHYATVVFSKIVSDEAIETVVPRISVGLFVVQKAGSSVAVQLTRSDWEASVFWLPKEVAVEIQNTGNTHVVPRASTRVLDQRGNTIAEGVFNQDSRMLLPGKKLEERVSLRSVRAVFWPQKLIFSTAYRADASDELKTVEKTVWYVPFKGILVLCATLFLAWRAFHSCKKSGFLGSKLRI